MSDDYFHVSQVGGVQIVALKLPESTDSNEFDRINEQLLDVFGGGPRGRWVVDLSGLHYMGSSALGLMVNIRQRILQSGGDLVLCGLSPQLLRIFRTCCMERLFRISKTQADALRAIGD
jgi:stage II sporulation protein AA (anti-sigma F factor antagonist)